MNPLYGLDTYNGQFSRPTGGPADALTYSIADFLFGLRSELFAREFLYRQLPAGDELRLSAG